MATIEMSCPVCHVRLKVPQSTVGHKGRCPRCLSKFIIPSPADSKTGPREIGEDQAMAWLGPGPGQKKNPAPS